MADLPEVSKRASLARDRAAGGSCYPFHLESTLSTIIGMDDIDEYYEDAWDDGWRAAVEELLELIEALVAEPPLACAPWRQLIGRFRRH